MQFQYIEKDRMTLKEFGEANHEKLPKLLYIVEGNYGTTIYDEAATGEVIRVHGSVTQRRVLARENVANQPGYLSLPLDTPYQFCVVIGQDNVLKPCSLRSIVQENSSFPIKVKLAPEYKTFKVGQSVHEARQYCHLLLMQEYDETFLCCNTIQGNGAVSLEVMQLALSSEIDVAIVTGITNKSAKKFREFLDKVNKDVAKVDFTTRVGNPDITRVTKEGTGSGNPLPELNFNLFQGNEEQVNKINSSATDSPSNDAKFKRNLNVTPQKEFIIQEPVLSSLKLDDNVEYPSTDHSISSPTASDTNNEDKHISSQDVYNDTVNENTKPHTGHDKKQIEINFSASGIYEQMDECTLHQIELKSIETLVPSVRNAKRKRDAPSGVYEIPNDSGVREFSIDDKETKQETSLLSKPNVPIVSGLYEIPNDTDIIPLSNPTLEPMSPPLPPQRQILRTTNLGSGKSEDEGTKTNEMLTKQEGHNKNLDSGIYEEAVDTDSAVPNQNEISNDSAIYEAAPDITDEAAPDITDEAAPEITYQTAPEIEFTNTDIKKKNESKQPGKITKKESDIPDSKSRAFKNSPMGPDVKKTNKKALPEIGPPKIKSTDGVMSGGMFNNNKAATEIGVRQSPLRQESILQSEAPAPPPMTNRIKQKLEKTFSLSQASVYMAMGNPKQVPQERNKDSAIYEAAPDITDEAAPEIIYEAAPEITYESASEIEFTNTKMKKKNETKQPGKITKKGSDIPDSKGRTFKKSLMAPDLKKTNKKALPVIGPPKIKSTDGVMSGGMFNSNKDATEIGVRQSPLRQESIQQSEAPAPPPMTNRIKQKLEKTFSLNQASVYMAMCNPKQVPQERNKDSAIYEAAPDITDEAAPEIIYEAAPEITYEAVSEIELTNTKMKKKNETKQPGKITKKGSDIPDSKGRTFKKSLMAPDLKKTNKKALPVMDPPKIKSTDGVMSGGMFNNNKAETEIGVRQSHLRQESILQSEAPAPPPMTHRIKQKLEKTFSLSQASVYMAMGNPKQVPQERSTRGKGRDDITKIKGESKILSKVEHEQSIYEEMDRPLQKINLRRAKYVKEKPQLPLSNPPKRKHISDKVLSPVELGLYVSTDDLTLNYNVSGNILKPEILKREDNRSCTLPKSFEPSEYMEMGDLTKSLPSRNPESGNQIYEDMAVAKK